MCVLRKGIRDKENRVKGLYQIIKGLDCYSLLYIHQAGYVTGRLVQKGFPEKVPFVKYHIIVVYYVLYIIVQHWQI